MNCEYENKIVIFGYDENWLLIKNVLENINISIIKTIMDPLYDIDKYVLCKRSNIHLYLSYEID